jgi:thiol-disulfide isomerase/thioredoxin
MMRIGALVCAAVLLVAGCSSGDDAVVRGNEFQLVSPGGKTEIFYDGSDRKKLGDMSGESLMEDGKQIKLSDYAGKVVVLNLWGSWCGPCRAEAPELQKLYDETKDAGVQLLGVDLRDDIRSAPLDFMRDRKLTYPSIYDPGGRSLLALKGYPRNSVPGTIIVDRQGRVAAVYLLPQLEKDLRPTVDRLAAESA